MYRKNTAGQFICVQLLLTATGAVATGLAPAARRCIDGTFAAGGGAFTEDGATGSYKYALAQADTNGNDISIIVTAAGAIPVCVNFVTTAADPTDGVHFGLTALPNAAANAAGGLPVSIAGALDLDEMNVDIEAIQSGQLTAAQVATGVWQDTTAGDFTAANSIGKSVMNGVALGTGLTINAYAGNTPQTGDSFVRLGAPAGASIAADLAEIEGETDTIIAGVTVTTNNDKAGYALTAGERTGIADALLDRDMSVGADSGTAIIRTVRQALRFLRNKWSIAGTTLTVCKEDDVTTTWTSTLATTVGANPVTTSDPAGP